MAITKIGTPELFDFSATNTALQLPTGDTASRPSAPSAGEWRFNSELKYVEYWDGGSPGAWRQIDTEELPLSDDFPSQNFNVNTYIGNGATQAIDAKFNEAANFNGASSGSQIFISDADVFSPANNDLSFSVWVKTSSTSGGYFASKQDDSTITYEWQFYMNTNGTVVIGIFTSTGTTIAVATSTATVNDGNWHNVAFVIDTNTSITVYVDKAGVTNSSWSGTMSNTSTDVLLGAGGGVPSFRLQGMLDQARFFNTAITQSQIDSLYDSETTTTAATLDFPSGAGCFAAYQLDGDASDVGGTYGGVTTDIGYTGLKFQPDFVWIKSRSNGRNHRLLDSIRGATKVLSSDSASNEYNEDSLTSFDSNGFTLGTGGNQNRLNETYVAWCWKAGGAPDATNSNGAGVAPTLGSVMIDGVKSTAALTGTIVAKKISANTNSGFSIVQYDGTGTAGTIDHLLGVVPNLVIVKRTDTSGNWIGGSTELDSNSWAKILQLDLADLEASYTGFNNTAPTTSVFSLGTNNPVNNSAGNYIAYCFANKNGYQRISTYTGTGNNPGPIVYTTNDGTATGTGGFEPAMIIIKRTDSIEDWKIIDNKRGFVNSLEPNEAIAEEANNNSGFIAATNGFQINDTSGDYNANGGTYLYLAIAADKDSSVPTQANSFSPTLYTANGATQNIYTPFAPDFVWAKSRVDTQQNILFDSVRGAGNHGLISNLTLSESGVSAGANGNVSSFDTNGFTVNVGTNNNPSNNYTNDTSNGGSYVSWNWKAGGLPTINNDGDIPSIVSANQNAGFSIVKYTGNGTAGATVGHGLGSKPELFFIKQLNATRDWIAWCNENNTELGYLNHTDAFENSRYSWALNSTQPTLTTITFSNDASTNGSSNEYIVYCFKSITGYSKIGSYTSQYPITTSVDVGFQPRFVMIKSYNQPRNWVIHDSARGADEQLYANLSNQEGNTGTQLQFTSTGFNASGGGNDLDGGSSYSYIYLAIA